MKKIYILFLMLMFSGCSTVAGVGKDVTDAAEWSKEKISKELKNKK